MIRGSWSIRGLILVRVGPGQWMVQMTTCGVGLWWCWDEDHCGQPVNSSVSLSVMHVGRRGLYACEHVKRGRKSSNDWLQRSFNQSAYIPNFSPGLDPTSFIRYPIIWVTGYNVLGKCSLTELHMGALGPTFDQCSHLDNLVLRWSGIWANFTLIEPLVTVWLSLKEIFS